MSKILKTKTPLLPKAVGPYSLVVVAGDLIFCSGQIAVNPADNKLITGGIREQTKQVLENLQAVLAEAGADLSRVVKTEVFLANMADYALMNEIYAKYFTTKPLPARVTVGVARLPKDALLEISCVAYKK
jgi:2-iminobutanoate/2-iminopropanoate deaminase